jgi:hypothetical protein
MADGGWRVGMVMDAAASPEEAAGLGAVFSGGSGGPMAALVPLIGEMLGVETAPVEYVDDGLRYSVRAGDLIDIEPRTSSRPSCARTGARCGHGLPVGVPGICRMSGTGRAPPPATAGRHRYCQYERRHAETDTQGPAPLPGLLQQDHRDQDNHGGHVHQTHRDESGHERPAARFITWKALGLADLAECFEPSAGTRHV